jgi:hypothetical protein
MEAERKMEDKDRVNAYIDFYKQQMEHYHKKQEMEARGSFGVWTLLAAAIYLVVEKNVYVSFWVAVPAVAAVLAIHFFWLWRLRKSEGIDREMWVNYRDKAEHILEPGQPTGPDASFAASEEKEHSKNPKANKTSGSGRLTLIFFEPVGTLLLCLFLLVFLARNAPAHADPLAATKWRFVASGDSRNCGDVVMPAIAAQSARYAPEFYWHLGDLRAIFKIDEDMDAASTKAGQPLTCQVYHRRAWDDFIENQIAPFGSTPFYLGIGNHETIPPKTEDKFVAQFAHWLSSPRLQKQRRQDGDNDPRLPRAYYHWIQGGVDFIYLDNASGSFTKDQVSWFDGVLAKAKDNDSVRSIVVGMHEALPDSIASDHSMCDNPAQPESCTSGRHVYQALLDFQNKKPVYVLASHSHFYMDGIFNNLPSKLPGWIVGTAGAIRYKLPGNAPPTAKEGVYGYVVGTVNTDGHIDFDFHQVEESDVPENVQKRYPDTLVPWCFTQNSKIKNPKGDNEGKQCHP